MARSLVLAGAAALAVAAPIPPNIANITFLTEEAAKLGAVCLDGSPAAFYFRAGADARKFYIHQQGGGWCESDSDCLGRSTTRLGSSKGYNASTNLGGGYFSNDPAQNPMMYSWSKVFLPYCDGSSQTSDLETPVDVPGAKAPIFYRGHRILKAIQARLLSTPSIGLAQATDVVISGCSAGGLATYLHADEWAAVLPKSAKVVSMPDSGYFLDYNATEGNGYGAALRWVATRMNGTGTLPAACLAANPEDPAKCIFAEHVAVTLATPTFALQSEYDSWQVANILQQKDTNVSAVNGYGKVLTQRITDDLINGRGNANNGMFLDSCYHHCGAWGQLGVNGVNQPAAFQTWYENLGKAGAQRTWAQDQVYPCQTCCSDGGSEGCAAGAELGAF